MNSTDRASLLQLLSQRREAIVETWHRTLIQAGFATIGADEMHKQLAFLVDQCIHLLLAQPFDYAGAAALGDTLASWHITHPEALDQTQQVLMHAFTAELAADCVAALMPNLVELIQALSIGFIRRAQQWIISEQEQILNALLAERTSVVQALRASEERLRTIMNNLPITIFSINCEGIITLIEGHSLEITGFDVSKLIGQSIFVVASSQPRILANVHRALAGETFTDTTTVSNTVLETRLAPLFGQDGQVYGLIGVAMDVTEQRRMQAELTEARYLISVSRDDERRRLARNLHDGVVQQLLGLSYQLTQVKQHFYDAALLDAQLIEELVAVQESIQQGLLDVITQLRHSISELRPVGLDDLGLTMALDIFVAQLGQEVGATLPVIELDLDWVGTEMPLSAAHCLFRVAQESIRNALRYAQASRIDVVLRVYDKTTMLRVSDNGIGFKMPPHITQFVRTQHFGLVGLLEQVEYLHGNLSIWSEPGEGVEVIVELPLIHRSSEQAGQG